MYIYKKNITDFKSDCKVYRKYKYTLEKIYWRISFKTEINKQFLKCLSKYD